MKLQSTLAAIALAAVSATSFAADEPKPMAPHSHMQEKMGVAPPAAAPAEKKADEAVAPKKQASKKKADKAKHLHTRDGK